MLQKAIELLVSCFATAELFNVTVLVQPQSKNNLMCFNFHSFSKTNTCNAHLWISASHTHYKCGVFSPLLLLEEPWSWTALNITALGFSPLASFLLLNGDKSTSVFSHTVLMHYEHPANATVLFSQPSQTCTINGTGTLCQQSCYCWLKFFQKVSGVITGKRHLLSWIVSHQCTVCSSCHRDASYTPHILLPIESKFYVVDQT